MNDDRTLDEINKDAVEQLEQAVNDGDLFQFIDRKQALAFQVEAVQKAMSLMGMPNSEIMDVKMIDSLMKTKRIQIESRRYHEEENLWKTGVYVYRLKEDMQNIDELAYFISTLKTVEPGTFSRNRTQMWGIKTNVPMDGSGTFFSIPKMVGEPNVRASDGKPGAN